MSDKKTVVYATAVCDLLHIGHLKYFQNSRKLGDTLIVGVLSDEAVRNYKREPVIPFDERLELTKELRIVDDAICQDDIDPTENLKKIKPDILTHGSDWSRPVPGEEYMLSVGGRVEITPYYFPRSTTQIIQTIKKRKDLFQ